MKAKQFLFVFLITLLMIILVYGSSSLLIITNRGMVKTIGINIYEDNSCSVPLTEIDWGMVEPGSTVTYNGWLRNEGNIPVTVNMHVENWLPIDASDFMALTWDNKGVEVGVNETVSCVFALHIFSNVTEITDFSFDILLVGSEV